MKKLLVVDDSPAVRESVALILGAGLEVRQSATLPAAELLREKEPLDLLIWGVSGAISNIPSLRKFAVPFSLAVLFLVDSEIFAPPQHADEIDYLRKPFQPYELREKALRLLSRKKQPLLPELAGASARTTALEYPYLASSTAVLAERFARARLSVLICGEVGSHHERVARAMYELGAAGEPWVALYAAELDEERCSERLGGLTESLSQAGPGTLYLDGLERLGPRAQAALLRFLNERSARGGRLWTLAASRIDLLERVYRGEFLEALYYEVAPLTLRIAPLRERAEDLPALARRLARDIGRRLGLGDVDFSPEALTRMTNYLWFGNLAELEAVIARTLSAHRVRRVEAHHLIFGMEYRPVEMVAATGAEGQSALGGAAAPGAEIGGLEPSRSRNGALDVTALITELAHELKNPMVTIKTFSQLLEERYEDAAFRSRFSQMVCGDVDRMDDVLELLLEFSHFGRPSPKPLDMQQALADAWGEVVAEAERRKIRLQASPSRPLHVRADPAQLRFILRNLLRGVLFDARPEIAVGVEAEEAELTLSYAREGATAPSFGDHLAPASSPERSENLPLKMLLAKLLAERNGGSVRVDYGDGGEARVRIRFPTETGVEGA